MLSMLDINGLFRGPDLRIYVVARARPKMVKAALQKEN
jgi:hypothetical protein